MTNSVTFPVALGGDGKTYTDDADPDTGLDGLGYTTRLVPLFKNGLAMAGYTAQYAAKIDAAAANADRAEDAKAYVEAVAEAYKVDLLDQFKRQATLGLDFVEGRYWVDDGEQLESSNFSDVMSFSRSGSKLELTPDFNLSPYADNQLARAWRGGVCHGASIDPSMTSLLINPDSAARWTGIRTVVSHSDFDFLGGSEKSLLVAETSESGIHAATISSPSSALGNGSTYSVALIIKAHGRTRVELRGSSSNGWVSRPMASFDIQTGAVINGEGGVEPIGGGWYLVWAYGIADNNNSAGMELLLLSSSGQMSYQGEPGAGVLIRNAQIVAGTYPGSPIPTTDATVTRPGDIVTRQNGREFNRKEGTYFLKGVRPKNASFLNALKYLIFLNSSETLGSGEWIGLSIRNSLVQLRTSVSGTLADVPADTSGVPLNIAFTYKQGEVNIAVNGELRTRQMLIDASSADFLKIGRSSAESTNFSLTCEGVYYVPVAVSASVLRELTL